MKKILFVSLLALFALFSACSSEAETPTSYFDLTVSEVESGLADWGIALEPVTVIDIPERDAKVAAYTFSSTNDTTGKKMHYSIEYHPITEKVSSVSFFFDKTFMGELSSARTRFLYHISSIAQIINSNTDTDALYDGIENVDGVNEGIDGSALYKTDDFILSASCDDTFFDASFWKPTVTE